MARDEDSAQLRSTISDTPGAQPNACLRAGHLDDRVVSLRGTSTRERHDAQQRRLLRVVEQDAGPTQASTQTTQGYVESNHSKVHSTRQRDQEVRRFGTARRLCVNT